MVGNPPNSSFDLAVITCIPSLDGRPYSEKMDAPIVPFGAVLVESYVFLMADGPFPFALLPVYAYQCVRFPVAKLILTGQVCVWENDRKQINNVKTAILYFIKRRIGPVNY
jgi:hypothetical protein